MYSQKQTINKYTETQRASKLVRARETDRERVGNKCTLKQDIIIGEIFLFLELAFQMHLGKHIRGE